VSSNTVRGVTVVHFLGDTARVLEAPLMLAGLREAAYWNGSVIMVYGGDYYVEARLAESRVIQWLVEIPWASEVYLERVSVTRKGPLATGRALVNGSMLGLVLDLTTGEAILVNWTKRLRVDSVGIDGGSLWAFLRPTGDWGILAEIRGGGLLSAVKIVLPSSFTLTSSGFNGYFWMAGRLLGDEQGFAAYWGLSTTPGVMGEGYLVKAMALPVDEGQFSIARTRAFIEAAGQAVAVRDSFLPVEKTVLEPAAASVEYEEYGAVVDRAVLFLALTVLTVSASALLYSAIRDQYW
jgi:hypothetical protein